MIRLTTKGKYGILMLTEIASQDEGRAIPLKVIAKKQNISEKYLEQIIIPLTKAGIVRSIRGSQGGYVMGMEPRDITAGQILEILEGEQSMRACIGEVGGCPRMDTCATIDLWMEMNAAMRQVVERITLADLVHSYLQKVEAAAQRFAGEEPIVEKPACNE